MKYLTFPEFVEVLDSIENTYNTGFNFYFKITEYQFEASTPTGVKVTYHRGKVKVTDNSFPSEYWSNLITKAFKEYPND